MKLIYSFRKTTKSSRCNTISNSMDIMREEPTIITSTNLVASTKVKTIRAIRPTTRTGIRISKSNTSPTFLCDLTSQQDSDGVRRSVAAIPAHKPDDSQQHFHDE